MTDSTVPGAESVPTVPTGEIPRAAIGFALDRAFADRLSRATANAALLLTLQDVNADDLCDILVLDPRRIAPASADFSVVRRHVEANVPCVYYTASSPEALRSVVAASDVSPVRLVLFDVDDDPRTFREVIDLAPRQAHTTRLRLAMKEALQPLRKASPALFRRLVSDRNARWTTELDARLKGKGRTVVVVGVGHLVGDDGLPSRLRALGYSVTGP